jgi:methylmalonyl-CoA/ethylmalonyl-CoA epimerase
VSQPHLRVDHIGIAVEDLATARVQFAKLFGIDPSPIEEVPEEAVRVSFFDFGGCRIELLEATSNDSPVRRFLDKRRQGVHHVSLALEEGELDGHFAALKANGVQLIGDQPHTGSGGSRVFFVHPGSAGGVLLEFSQFDPSRPKEARSEEKNR